MQSKLTNVRSQNATEMGTGISGWSSKSNSCGPKGLGPRTHKKQCHLQCHSQQGEMCPDSPNLPSHHSQNFIPWGEISAGSILKLPKTLVAGSMGSWLPGDIPQRKRNREEHHDTPMERSALSFGIAGAAGPGAIYLTLCCPSASLVQQAQEQST